MNLNLIGMYVVLTKSFQNHVGFRANKENCLEKDDWRKILVFAMESYYLLSVSRALGTQNWTFAPQHPRFTLSFLFLNWLDCLFSIVYTAIPVPL